MPIPIAVPIVGGIVLVGTGIGLRLRALSKAKLVNGNLPPAAGSATPTVESRAVARTIPNIPPPIKRADGFVPPEELARALAAEKIRASQLTTDQLRAVEQNAVPGQTVAPFDGNGTAGGTPMPPGTFKPGDILPTDHVSINIKTAGLTFPLLSNVTGDLLIRATEFNTESSVRGVSIDPRVDDPTERDFPLAAVTGVGPVNF